MNLLPLWINLSKARKGERVGGRYVHRWWNSSQGRWNYKYSDTKHKNHGVAHSAKAEHSVDAPKDTKAKTPEKAFHASRQEAMRGDQTHTADYHDPEGKPLYRVVVKPGVAKPIEIHHKRGKEAPTRQRSFETLENWHRRDSTVTTVLDAFKRPWFDVRQRGGEDGSGRLSVRYYADSPFNPFPNEEPKWVPAPVGSRPGKQTLTEWVQNQRRLQRESRTGQTKPAKRFKPDKDRPLTTFIEQGNLHWTTVQSSLKGKRGKRWVREAKLTTKERREVYLRALEEHFGVAVITAARTLRHYELLDSENLSELLGVRMEPWKRAKQIQVQPESPVFHAIQRAVNTYDPSKGWRFSTYMRECFWWEFQKATKQILDDIKRQQRQVTTTTFDGRERDVVDQMNLQQDAAPGHEEVIGSGAHLETADQHLERKQELLQQWRVRQEAKLAKVINETEDKDRRAAAFAAKVEMKQVKNIDQARKFVIDNQSEGGDEFAEPIIRDTEDLPGEAELTTKEKKDWIRFVSSNPGLSNQERTALLEIAPDGDLAKRRPFDKVSAALNKKYPNLFPKPPTSEQVVQLFLHAHTVLANHPEYDAMARKLSPVEKALAVLRKSNMRLWLSAVDIMRKAMRGGRTYKYFRREGHPGHYKYIYREDKTNNHVHATNAPPGHEHHEKRHGHPQLHSSEPDPDRHPQFFDPRTGRKMNRSVPAHAEWNEGYNAEEPLSMWAARWRHQGDDEAHLEHAYYDSDLRERDELKFNLSNRHFDEQLPKVRGFYKSLMQSKQPASQALGLMVALLDQAHMRAGRKVHEDERGTLGLCTLKVKNVRVRGNAASFVYVGKKGVKQEQTITLDSTAMSILQSLIEGKSPNEYLFAVPVKIGGKVTYREIGYNKLRRNLAVLGVTPKQFRTYHGTEIFSKTFQEMFGKVKGRPTRKILDQITEAAALETAKALGHYVGTGKDRKAHSYTALRSYIDPTVVRSLYINAMDPNSMNKAFRLQGRMEFQGLPISIENRKGSVRKWYNPHDKTGGETKMHCPYGYIRRTEGTDGDHVDVYVGPNKDADTAYVVHQMKAPDFKRYDEDKVMLGFDSPDEAKAAYIKQYDNPKFFGKMSVIPMSEFKEKVLNKENHGKMVKAMFDDPEEGDDDGVPIINVTSDPPHRFPDEEHFHYWLHTHPIHESEHEYEGLKQMGMGELHTPEADHEDAEDEDSTNSAASEGQQGIELARQDSGGDESQQEPEQAQQPSPAPDASAAAPQGTQQPQQGGMGSVRPGAEKLLRQNPSEVRGASSA